MGMVSDAVFFDVDATSVAAAASGDSVAFARIVTTHHDAMVRVAFVISRDHDLAQDATQIAWSIAWRKLRGLREPDRLRSWLITIAANETRALVERQRRQFAVDVGSIEVMSDHADPGITVTRVDLGSALGRLRPDERQILALRHVAGFDATEIGRAMGLSPSGVRSRLARATERLRRELDDA
jgi:RNA polymerase sigma-70 factor, ECF subfamily